MRCESRVTITVVIFYIFPWGKKVIFVSLMKNTMELFLCPLEELWTAVSHQNVTAVSPNADNVTSAVA